MKKRIWIFMTILTLLALNLAVSSHTPDPTNVTIAGSLQSELGCPGDWQPDCTSTQLGYDSNDDVWQATFSVPAGSWEYKAALNDSWDENYGANGTQDGPNIPLGLGAAADVKFYYDHKSHWVTDNVNTIIATVPGSFQSEIGCPGDWDPSCLRSWLQDPEGDGIYSFSTSDIQAGSYEAKVAHNESWDVNYGAGGVQNGSNIPFTVGEAETVTFEYDPATHLLTITSEPTPPPGPSSVTIAGSLQSELGCPGDWQPDCDVTHLAYDANDDVWQATFSIPAGSWEYKAALNGSWDENYGQNATQDGANIPLNLGAATEVKFYYDHKSHWVTDNVNSVIATVPGSFQSEIGCSGDWEPDCLRSWLQDTDGDGIYSFSTSDIPAGSYEAKVAHNESWDVNYGAGGELNGFNIPFTVESHEGVTFSYNPETHILAISVYLVNHPPMVEVDAPSIDASEGSTATNSGTISDADGDTLTMSATMGAVVNNNDGTWSWSYVTVDGPEVHSVTITADDGNGGVSEVTFELSVLNVAPTISAVSNDGPILAGGQTVISVDASDPAGANDPLSYSFDCDNDGAFEIGPQPGATATCSFNDHGDFIVNVKVDDDDSAFATASTVVPVILTLQDGIDDLIGDEVEDLVEAGSLNEGQGNALLGKLKNAKKKLDQGKTNAALNLLNAFINQVNSFISEGILTPAEGQALIDAANGIINLI